MYTLSVQKSISQKIHSLRCRVDKKEDERKFWLLAHDLDLLTSDDVINTRSQKLMNSSGRVFHALSNDTLFVPIAYFFL